MGEGRVVASTAVAAVTALVLLLSVWAASVGPDDPLRGDGVSPSRVTTRAPTEVPTSVEPREDRPLDREDDDGPSGIATVVGVVVTTIAVLLAAAGLWLFGAALWRLRRVRVRGAERAVDPPPLDSVHAVAAAMAADADEHVDLLASGSPRNAVVQCWHRFELQAEGAGVPRRPWETPSEFTMRLLDLVEADSSVVSRLAELYREARFSEHELGEDARSAALDAVRGLHRDLDARWGGGQR